MTFSLETLKNIFPDAQFVGLNDVEEFNLLNIAHLKQFESLSPKHVLYFVVYEDNPDQLGWYDRAFDRSLNLPKLINNKQVVAVVNNRVPNNQVVGLRYIRVKNIYQAIDTLRQYVLAQIHPLVIGVTGSVGKTTAIALIQNVVGKQFNCGRIYSKRLTPLTLSSWLVNFLESSHQILALEYLMYRKYHIDMLIDLLRPNIGVFLNVKRMHLGVEGINTLEDIIEGKRALVEKSQVAILNLDDPFVSRLQRTGDIGFSLVDPMADVYISTDNKDVILLLNYAGQVIRFVPYVKTTLFYQQACTAALAGSYLGMSAESIQRGLEEFSPAEQRINWINIHGEKILFDGDVTYGARMMALAEHHYQSSILLIHSLDFGGQIVDNQIDDVTTVFAHFSKVRILETEENRALILRYGWKNLRLVSKKDLLTDLSEFEFKIFHFGIYFRKHKDLNYLMNFLNT